MFGWVVKTSSDQHEKKERSTRSYLGDMAGLDIDEGQNEGGGCEGEETKRCRISKLAQVAVTDVRMGFYEMIDDTYGDGPAWVAVPGPLALEEFAYHSRIA
jgi:hypothetical protein